MFISLSHVRYRIHPVSKPHFEGCFSYKYFLGHIGVPVFLHTVPLRQFYALQYVVSKHDRLIFLEILASIHDVPSKRTYTLPF